MSSSREENRPAIAAEIGKPQPPRGKTQAENGKLAVRAKSKVVPGSSGQESCKRAATGRVKEDISAKSKDAAENVGIVKGESPAMPVKKEVNQRQRQTTQREGNAHTDTSGKAARIELEGRVESGMAKEVTKKVRTNVGTVKMEIPIVASTGANNVKTQVQNTPTIVKQETSKMGVAGSTAHTAPPKLVIPSVPAKKEKEQIPDEAEVAAAVTPSCMVLATAATSSRLAQLTGTGVPGASSKAVEANDQTASTSHGAARVEAPSVGIQPSECGTASPELPVETPAKKKVAQSGKANECSKGGQSKSRGGSRGKSGRGRSKQVVTTLAAAANHAATSPHATETNQLPGAVEAATTPATSSRLSRLAGPGVHGALSKVAEAADETVSTSDGNVRAETPSVSIQPPECGAASHEMRVEIPTNVHECSEQGDGRTRGGRCGKGGAGRGKKLTTTPAASRNDEAPSPVAPKTNQLPGAVETANTPATPTRLGQLVGQDAPGASCEVAKAAGETVSMSHGSAQAKVLSAGFQPHEASPEMPVEIPAKGAAVKNGRADDSSQGGQHKTRGRSRAKGGRGRGKPPATTLAAATNQSAPFPAGPETDQLPGAVEAATTPATSPKITQEKAGEADGDGNEHVAGRQARGRGRGGGKGGHGTKVTATPPVVAEQTPVFTTLAQTQLLEPWHENTRQKSHSGTSPVARAQKNGKRKRGVQPPTSNQRRKCSEVADGQQTAARVAAAKEVAVLCQRCRADFCREQPSQSTLSQSLVRCKRPCAAFCAKCTERLRREQKLSLRPGEFGWFRSSNAACRGHIWPAVVLELVFGSLHEERPFLIRFFHAGTFARVGRDDLMPWTSQPPEQRASSAFLRALDFAEAVGAPPTCRSSVLVPQKKHGTNASPCSVTRVPVLQFAVSDLATRLLEMRGTLAEIQARERKLKEHLAEMRAKSGAASANLDGFIGIGGG